MRIIAHLSSYQSTPQVASVPRSATVATHQHPFDRAMSLRLDRVIHTLDRRPPWPQRLPLQLHKAWLERRVPRVLKGGAR